MSEMTLSKGAEALWHWLARAGKEASFTAHGFRAVDAWLAKELGVSPRTVRRYRAALMEAGILRQVQDEQAMVTLRLTRTPPYPDGQAALPLHLDPVAAAGALERFVANLIQIGAAAGADVAELSLLYEQLVLANGIVDNSQAAGQPLSHASVEDGTRDNLSRYEEEHPILNFPFERLTTTTPPEAPDAPDEPPPPPRHVLRALVESYGVFSGPAYAIARRMAAARYTQADAELLLRRMWQDTRGQGALIAYRLRKSALPTREAVRANLPLRPSPRNAKDERARELFREMLE